MNQKSSAPPARSGFTLLELLVVIGLVAMLASLLFPALIRARSAVKAAECQSNLRQLGLALSLYTGDFQAFPGAPPEEIQNPEGTVFSTAPQTAGRGLAQMAPYAFRAASPSPSGGVPLATRKSVLLCPARAQKTLMAPERFSYYPYGYGYNALGTVWRAPAAAPLGLGPLRVQGAAAWVRESALRAPAEMIAIGDAHDELFGNITPYVRDRIPPGLSEIHGGGANIVFCDGHVEHRKRVRWTEASEAVRRRWNNDHEPHPETW